MDNYFLKDVIEIYPLATHVVFPAITDYLEPVFAQKLTDSGFYDTTKILARIQRKYEYNEIATSDISQFYSMLNQKIEENFSEYLMNLVTIADNYSIQNIDTRDITYTHVVDSASENLSIVNDTPGNMLNIENIKAGKSASGVEYNSNKAGGYTDTTNQESTSALNTTQSNVSAQIDLNVKVQKALNKFIDSLAPAFNIELHEYWGDEFE